jgi:hypothetical protein
VSDAPVQSRPRWAYVAYVFAALVCAGLLLAMVLVQSRMNALADTLAAGSLDAEMIAPRTSAG